MKNSTDLEKLLRSIDHRSYPAYKDTKGSYSFPKYVLSIDHVQGDPFASPSKVSIQIQGKAAGFPSETYDKPYKRTALCDYLLRLFKQKIDKYNFKAKGSGKSGLISVSKCGQEILERTACEISPSDGSLMIRLEVGFPANGRTINSQELIKIFFDFLPECVNSVCFYAKLDPRKVGSVISLSEDQQYIREQLPILGLTSFIANGSVLPRESGVSQRPMKDSVPFTSPASMEVTLMLPHRGPVAGMGIPKGITLIVGGGYHGKSTLLKALELGVYNHIGGDGREYVITDASAMKIRAEDGRSIKKADISMFVNDLPNGRDTVSFYTEDASGSTSQAANVVEAIESGSSLLLIDEDTSATNFMVRDELMQRVVHRDQEPITPFIERARLLYEKYGISSVIVAGSSGSYFHIADYIIQMDRYIPREITEFAKKEALAFPMLTGPAGEPSKPSVSRCPSPSPEVKGNSRLKMKTMGRDGFSINRENIDLRYVEQLADSEQCTALGYILTYAENSLFNGRNNLQSVVNALENILRSKGLAAVVPGSYLPSGLAMPRRQEIFACLNRYRGLNV
ncbi:ABC-ATPase domain-containing protein [Murimonas intestini]|uniref:ABC-class ATPase n=1 Tax=Murimonas intestini TaxID=1337051 RepID=A0AB73T9S2_9FIRM|nr:ABC-ATPase domain-containing protein [Murimonas intestini]MCR1839281.1 ABC-ATPase domain-containing protein [Murimonas intestini]MCR1864576.1 ABC-ATPase domain-containing protein [Murimonas intestini]MCR1882186.1 ABC-ATPase domain-containing protein [Murimonas intestini]